MNPIFIVLLSITGLFIALFLVKELIRGRFCVLCGSISLTWAALLLLLWTGRFQEPILIAVLLGESVTGVTSLLATRVREDLRLFRFPFFLSATYGAFLVLGKTERWPVLVAFFAALWAVFLLSYAYRGNKKLHGFVQKVIACCRDW